MNKFHKTIFITGLTIGSMLLAGCQDGGVANTNNASPVTGEPQVNIDATSESGKAGQITIEQLPLDSTTLQTITPDIDLSAQPDDSSQTVTE